MRFRTIVILFLVVIGYLFIGAAVFRKLESDHEQDRKHYSSSKLAKFLDSASCVSGDELAMLIRDIVAAVRDGVDVRNVSESPDHWNFGSSFFFSTTVITTIGYGHISPSTWEGRLFCMFYALIGIPIAAVFFAGVGQKLQKPVKALKRNVFCPATPRVERVTKSLVTGLLGLGVLVLLPAYGFYRVEEWTFMESVYYCIITITTIGFGDFVPGQQEKEYRTYSQVVTIVWIFLGLSWLSMLLSDMGDYLLGTVTRDEVTRDEVTRDVAAPGADKAGAEENGMVVNEDEKEREFTTL